MFAIRLLLLIQEVSLLRAKMTLKKKKFPLAIRVAPTVFGNVPEQKVLQIFLVPTFGLYPENQSLQNISGKKRRMKVLLKRMA